MPRTQEVEISDEQLGSMVDDTEREVANIWNDEEDDNDGDRSLEKPEDIEGLSVSDDLEPEDEEPEDEAAASDEDEEEAADEDEEAIDEEGRVNGQQLRDDRDERRPVPPSRLREEAEARRAAERANQELRERIARLEGAQQRQQPQQEQRPQEFPDPVLDPEGFRRAIREEQRQIARAEFEQERMTRVNTALNEAAQGENGWKLQAAIGHISSTLDPRNPEHARLVQGLVYSSDPAAALISHWEKNGGREHTDELFRRLAEERGYRVPEPARRQSQPSRRVAREDERPRNVTRIPKSLNSAGGHGRRVQAEDPDLYDESEESIAAYAWK